MRRIVAWALCALSVGSGSVRRAPAAEGVDVHRYDLEVTVGEKTLTGTTTLHATGRAPSRWVLDLAPEMKVRSVEAGGRPVPFEVSDRGLVLDLPSGADAGAGEFTVTLRWEGCPREENRGMGFVRSALSPDLVYIRSQYAWYPRVPDDPALVRTVVDAPSGRQVRAAGSFGPPKSVGKRSLWTFETKEPVERVGLAVGTWKSTEREDGGVLFDALFAAGHETGAEAAIEWARRAFGIYGKAFGPLPWDRLSLVELPREFGSGSGYCENGYVLFGPGAFEPPGASLQWTSHEVAHAWWAHGVRFSDFAAEALAEFSSYLAVREAEGEDGARRMRQEAVLRVAAAASGGKDGALAEVRGFGEGMDPGTYRILAYEKPMMIMAMIEQAVGADVLRGVLAAFFNENRGRRIGWTEVRGALSKAGPAARPILEQWERAGIPTLKAEFTAKKAGSQWAVKGTLFQEGTKPPFRMEVPVATSPTEKSAATTVRMAGADASFTLRASTEPKAIVIDPDWLLLAARKGEGSSDPKKDFDDAIAVSRDPGEADPKKLEEAIEKLRGVLASGENPGVCRVEIGRCLFRLGKLDEAREELEAGLRLGGFGPFPRSWALLRLGCIADLQKRRKDAVSHYKAVLALPDADNLKFQKGRAQVFLDRPYRGYEADR